MRPTTRRRGFTLVELLVAAALALVVMTVLSLAFQTGLQTLSQLKSVVGLAEQMRTAEGVLRRDLAAAHLEAADGRTLRLPQVGQHARGYFSFTQGGMALTTGNTPIGFGPFAESLRQPENGVLSFRTQSALKPAPQLGLVLTSPEPTADPMQLFGRAWMDTFSFTVRLKGDRPQEVFSAAGRGDAANPRTLLERLQARDPYFAALPVEVRSADPLGTQVTGRWAEVSYLLMPAGPVPTPTAAAIAPLPVAFTADEGGVAQLPLYTLYRRQRVLADRAVPSPTAATDPANFFGQQDAAQARGLAMASQNPALPTAPWTLLGPESVAGVGGGTTDSRLGGANDTLAPVLADRTGTALPTPSDLRTDLARRGYPIPSTATEAGSDVLVTNVLSMTVRPVYEFDVSQEVLTRLQPPFVPAGTVVTPRPKSLPDPTTGQPLPPSYLPGDWLELLNVRTDRTYTTANMPARTGLPTTPPMATNPSYPRFYDTAGPSKVGVVFRNAATNAILPVQWDQQDPNLFEVRATLKAIEVKLRVYDAKNKTSRQMTIVQDL